MKVIHLVVEFNEDTFKDDVASVADEVFRSVGEFGDEASCIGVTPSGRDFDFDLLELKDARIAECLEYYK